MWLLLVLFLVGLAAGRLPALAPWSSRAARPLASLGVVVVLLVLGARLGTDPDTRARLPLLGARAAVFAVCTVSGSVLAAALVQRRVGLP